MTVSVSLVVLTDVDGTLLDHRSYEFEPALPAIRLLERERIPLILCSSKTRAEIEWLQDQLGIRHPFVSENGGALFVPAGYFRFPIHGARHVDGYEAIEFGRPYPETVKALHAAARALSVHVTGFSDMSVPDVARECSLTLAQARLAKMREYDEPFLFDHGSPELHGQLVARLRAAGLHCTRGGRFAHATGATDKSHAVGIVRMLYRRASRKRVVTVGLGDAPNDAGLLGEVELPVIIRNPAARLAGQLLARVPHARLSQEQGPLGWGRAVEEVVRSVF